MGNETALSNASKHFSYTPPCSRYKSLDIFNGIVRTGSHGLWFAFLHKVREYQRLWYFIYSASNSSALTGVYTKCSDGLKHFKLLNTPKAGSLWRQFQTSADFTVVNYYFHSWLLRFFLYICKHLSTHTYMSVTWKFTANAICITDNALKDCCGSDLGVSMTVLSYRTWTLYSSFSFYCFNPTRSATYIFITLSSDTLPVTHTHTLPEMQILGCVFSFHATIGKTHFAAFPLTCIYVWGAGSSPNAK